MSIKAIRERIALEDHFMYQWNNPPAPFNPAITDEVLAKRKVKARIEKIIKDYLNDYHKTLKHLNNDDYYDAMDKKEAELRKQYLTT
ncbi:MAG: hypothetical protein WC679_02150 [Bacteroidales bacterium]|jgi:hypothetical protein